MMLRGGFAGHVVTDLRPWPRRAARPTYPYNHWRYVMYYEGPQHALHHHQVSCSVGCWYGHMRFMRYHNGLFGMLWIDWGCTRYTKLAGFGCWSLKPSSRAQALGHVAMRRIYRLLPLILVIGWFSLACGANRPKGARFEAGTAKHLRVSQAPLLSGKNPRKVPTQVSFLERGLLVWVPSRLGP